jgi:SPP1 family predicted phage head-tail adaptor
MSLKSIRGATVGIDAYTPPGSMDRRVQFMNEPSINDDGTMAAATLFAESWAKVQAVPLGWREIYKGQQISQQVSHMVTVPYLEGITEGMTINFDGRIFQIDSIMDPDERKVEQRCMCVERGQNAGQT